VQKQYRASTKKNAEFSVGYVHRVVGYAIGVANKIEMIGQKWDGMLEGTIKTCTLELSMSKLVTEDTISVLFKK